MYLLHRGTRGAESHVYGWLTWQRVALYSCTICVMYAIFLAVWAWSSRGFTVLAASRPGVDFSVFWAASHVMLHDSPWQAYDHLTFAKTELRLFANFSTSGFLPWVYPPAFLVIVTPLALIPFLISYLLFTGAGVLLLTHGTLRVSGLAGIVGRARVAGPLVAAFPSVFVAAVCGQNSLLSAALAAFAVHLVDRKPVQAGVCIGLLAVKPQMALVFPFVLFAARAWRVLAIAAFSALIIHGIGVMACGIESLSLFLRNAQFLREIVMEHHIPFWLASPTVFAALRVNGVPLIPAYIAQASVAVLAIAAACHVWRSTSDTRLRGSILVISTLIANPYVWHYELAWLGIALACMLAFGVGEGWLRGEQEIWIIAWLLPLFEYFNRAAQLPQVGPIVLLLLLFVTLRRARVLSRRNP